MKKILIAIDAYLSEIIPYMLVFTLLLFCLKGVGYVGYSWLTASYPVLFSGVLIGVNNFLIFILDQKQGR